MSGDFPQDTSPRDGQGMLEYFMDLIPEPAIIIGGAVGYGLFWLTPWGQDSNEVARQQSLLPHTFKYAFMPVLCAGAGATLLCYLQSIINEKMNFESSNLN